MTTFNIFFFLKVLLSYVSDCKPNDDFNCIANYIQKYMSVNTSRNILICIILYWNFECSNKPNLFQLCIPANHWVFNKTLFWSSFTDSFVSVDKLFLLDHQNDARPHLPKFILSLREKNHKQRCKQLRDEEFPETDFFNLFALICTYSV